MARINGNKWSKGREIDGQLDETFTLHWHWNDYILSLPFFDPFEIILYIICNILTDSVIAVVVKVKCQFEMSGGTVETLPFLTFPRVLII